MLKETTETIRVTLDSKDVLSLLRLGNFDGSVVIRSIFADPNAKDGDIVLSIEATRTVKEIL